MGKKVAIGGVAVLVFWVAQNYLVHHHLLGGLYEGTKSLWRAPEDVRFGVYMAVTVLSAFTFAFAYAKFVTAKSVATGLQFGLVLGLGFGALDAYIDFAFMPVPYLLALGWFVSYVIGWTVSGLILGKLIKD